MYYNPQLISNHYDIVNSLSDFTVYPKEAGGSCVVALAFSLFILPICPLAEIKETTEIKKRDTQSKTNIKKQILTEFKYSIRSQN